MPPKPYSLMGIFLIMGIAGCISSTVSAAMRPEDLDAQLTCVRLCTTFVTNSTPKQTHSLSLSRSLSFFRKG